MKKAFLIFSIVLSGCSTAPVKHEMPVIPVELTEKCSALYDVNDGEEKLSELLKIVNKNYGLYYECSARHESLIEWYNKQKKNHDDVHN